MKIDFPESALDGEEFEFNGYLFEYNLAKNKWTSKISYGAGGITGDAFSNPTTLNLVNSTGDIVKSLQATGSGDGKNTITQTRVDVVSTEKSQNFINLSNSDPYLIYYSTRDGIAEGESSWVKYTWPKSLTNTNNNIYFRLYCEAIGDELPTPSLAVRPITQLIVSTLPSNTDGSKIHNLGAFTSKINTGSENNFTNGDSVAYAFLQVDEDPTNSNNYAVWIKTYSIGDSNIAQLYISGYLKTTNVTSEIQDIQGLAEVFVSQNPPNEPGAGDIWYETDSDGSGNITYNTYIFNDVTKEWIAAQENEVIESDESDLPVGNTGEVVYYTQDNSQEAEAKSIADIGRYVVAGEVAAVTTPSARAEEIFNSWYRFSHSTSGIYPANAAQLEAWSYDPETGIIQCTANTGTYVGFVSDDAATNYTHEVTLTSASSDNDAVTVLMAFVTEGSFGQPGYREHTLSAVVTTGGFPPNVGWGVYYNYAQSDAQLIGEININPSGGWSGKTVRVRVEKNGKQWSATTSQFNSLTLDASTTITFNTDAQPYLEKFAGEVRYGYGAQSQDAASFLDPIVTGFPASVVFDMESETSYVFNQNAGEYQTDPQPYLDLGPQFKGRFLVNQSTGQLYYVDLNGNIYGITATPQLPNYSAGLLPSPDLPGQMIYVRDESGGAVPAFSDGTNWRRVTDRNIVS